MAKAHTLVDNFNDNSIDTTKWFTFANDFASEENQRLEIRPPSSAPGISYGGVSSTVTYDLTASEIRIELVRTLRAVVGTQVYFLAQTDVDNRVVIFVHVEAPDALSVHAYQVVAGTYTRLARVPYDPARHRWLRLREADGVLYWETSPDGQTWEVLASKAPPIALTAVTLGYGAGTWDRVPAPGVAIFDNFNVIDTSRARRVEERRLSAREVRIEAAELAAGRRHDEHANNNDEVNYPTRLLAGNFSKGLMHDALGDPDPGSYSTLLRALESRDPADFEEIILGTIPPDAKRMKLINPQTGLTFDLEGPDAQEITQPPAPRFDSEMAAHEAGELYWMAVARDIPFISYFYDATITAAVNSLNSEFPHFGGTVPVTTHNVFRGIYPGEQVGPYVSQFLLKGNQDPRKPAGQGRDATDGFVSYGSRTIDQRLFQQSPGIDYLTAFSTWLDAQNGVDKRGQDSFETTKRFITSPRGGATLVHFDQVLDAWYNAAWILMSEPAGNQLSGSTARPQIDLEFPKDQGNPYDPPGTAMDSKTQVGFATFGPTHLLQVLGEVLGRALRAVWYQKWFVHRRLRPEEYGGRVHNHVTGARTYPLQASITTSLASGGLAPYFGSAGEKFPAGYLLPQAFPEGAPTHPAYGAGHAAGSGALATMLKAFFDETTPIENPVLATLDGLSLTAYTEADAGQMTVGGELNKLAGNIALFRNWAGVHWRSDYTESLPLGEAVAIGLLQEMSLGFNEDDAYFQLTKFDGTTIRIFDGKVVPVT